MKLKLIVFDWDGTLMDSEARITDCMQRAFDDAGQCRPAAEQVRNVIGLGLKEAIRQLLPERDDAVHEAIKHHYRRRYLDQEGTPTPMFPGAADVIRELEQADYLLAVATGKGRSGLNQAMSQSGVANSFHATRCADETLSKPHPQMLMELMDVLGAMPAETLMIGDTEYDLQMALNAGAHALAVDYGVHGRERLLALQPRGCLDDVRKIPDWIADWQRAASA